MNYKFLSLIGALLIGCGGLMAQVYEDDIYYDGSSEVNKTTKVVVKQAPASVVTMAHYKLRLLPLVEW